MNKKSLILVSVFFVVLFLLSGFVYANNEIQDGTSSIVNGVVNGINTLGSDVRNGVGAAENGIEDALKIDDMGNNTTDNNMSNEANNTNAITDTDYSATRTATGLTGGTANDNYTLWIWLIVAIAAIVIIGLVWYYGAQNTTHRDE